MAHQLPDTLFSTFKESIGKGPSMVPCFKFVRSLTDEDAQEFLLGLMGQLTIAFDTGDMQPVLEHTYQWQLKAYHESSPRWSYDTGAFAPLKKPLSEARLALLTSSGHFWREADPEPFGIKNMTQDQAISHLHDFLKAAPELSAIPSDTPNNALCVRHGGYDVAGVQCDPNVAFPLELLRDFVEEGLIGELAPNAYSFVGACAQTRLLRHQGPEWVAMLKAEGIDAMLMVPA